MKDLPPFLERMLDLFFGGVSAFAGWTQSNQTLGAAFLAGTVAIVVARTTLHGVMLSLKASQEKTRQELAHSESQEHRNREHTRIESARERDLDAQKDRHSRLTAMRREVYLSAVTEFVKFQVLLGSLANRSLESMDAGAEVGAINLAVQRVTLVGEQETVVVARETHNALMRIFMACITKMLPISKLSNNIAFYEKMRQQSNDRSAGYVETMRQYNLSGMTDRGKFDAVLRQQKVCQDEVKDYSEKLRTLYDLKTATQLAFGDYVSTQVRTEVMERSDALAIAIRSELELKSDPEVFRTLSQATADQSLNAMAELKAALNS